jgi:hypothetical protein
VTPGLARADRAEAVRQAARSWLRAGVVDEAVAKAVDARYPDDRVRVGPVFRALLFLFTVIAVGGLFGFLSLLFDFNDPDGVAILALLAGAALVAATEVQAGPLRRRQGGTEAASSFLALGFLLAAGGWWIFDSLGVGDRVALSVFSLTAAGLLGAAAWRWGYPLYAGAATAALLVALLPLPGARLLWIVLPLVSAPGLLALSRSALLPPSHRASLTAVACVALGGLYAAIHVDCSEALVLADLVNGTESWFDGDVLLRASAVATGLVPAALLAAGIVRRRYALIVLGTLTSAVSLVTLRYHVHLAPLWLVLAASGALLVAAALALRRYLASGADGERYGFTASPLFTDLARQRVLEAGVAVLAFSPEARPLHEEPRYEGGGGEFGGGGASGSF